MSPLFCSQSRSAPVTGNRRFSGLALQPSSSQPSPSAHCSIHLAAVPPYGVKGKRTHGILVARPKSRSTLLPADIRPRLRHPRLRQASSARTSANDPPHHACPSLSLYNENTHGSVEESFHYSRLPGPQLLAASKHSRSRGRWVFSNATSSSSNGFDDPSKSRAPAKNGMTVMRSI